MVVSDDKIRGRFSKMGNVLKKPAVWRKILDYLWGVLQVLQAGLLFLLPNLGLAVLFSSILAWVVLHRKWKKPAAFAAY